jgi:hypothetical protein
MDVDPDAALETMRSLVADHLAGEVPPDGAWEHLGALAETVRALDDWLTAGGFLPGAWDGTASRIRGRHRPPAHPRRSAYGR